MLCEHGHIAPCVECDIGPLKAENAALRKRVKELEAALNEQLNDCINFDGSKLTDTIMEKSTAILRGGANS